MEEERENWGSDWLVFGFGENSYLVRICRGDGD